MSEAPDDDKYDKEHLAIWSKAGLTSVVLKPLTYNQAYALRAQLYRLRKRLIKDRHAVATAAKEGTIKFFPERDTKGNDYFVLMVHPKNMGLESAYINAGIIGVDSEEEEPPPL